MGGVIVKNETLERYAWAGGIVFVAALVAETVVAVGIPATANDSPAKLATELAAHHQRLVAIACISIFYAVGFVVYLTNLHRLLRDDIADGSRLLLTWVPIGGVVFVTLHAVSDIGITGMLGAKVAAYSASNDPGLAYSFYLLTYAIDSVGDVFASLFVVAAGVLLRASGVVPRWLAWIAILVGPLFLLQGFGLGGVIATFGLVLDLIGFLLFLIFVLVSSIVLLRRRAPESASPPRLGADSNYP